MVLSDAARSVWAKSRSGDGLWLPYWQHGDDAGDIVGGLFDVWLPRSVVRLLAEPFGGDTVAARVAVAFLAALHDFGKVTPPFAVQDAELASQMRDFELDMPLRKVDMVDQAVLHHSVAGHHLLCRWLINKGWSRNSAVTWGVVLAGHHGVPPDSLLLNDLGPAEVPQLYGQGRWEQVQQELADRAAIRTGACQYLDRWRGLKMPGPPSTPGAPWTTTGCWTP